MEKVQQFIKILKSCVMVYFLFLILKLCSTVSADVKAKDEQEKLLQVEKEKAKQKIDEENKIKGFHCLSPWDGSHYQLVRVIKKSMADPDSFKHRETSITPVHLGEHLVYMKYSGTNGFGGKSFAEVGAIINSSDCSVSKIISSR